MAKTKSNSETELVVAIQSLTEEVRVLRQVVDELREEVQWANRNPPEERAHLDGRRIRSCSLDPTSRDFTVNSVDKETVDRIRADVVTSNRLPRTQGKLFG